MDRFTYRDVSITISAGLIRDDDELEYTEDVDGYGVYDGRHGNTDEAWIAFSRDPDTAQRICSLLNADEAIRATGTYQSHLAAARAREKA